MRSSVPEKMEEEGDESRTGGLSHETGCCEHASSTENPKPAPHIISRHAMSRCEAFSGINESRKQPALINSRPKKPRSPGCTLPISEPASGATNTMTSGQEVISSPVSTAFIPKV